MDRKFIDLYDEYTHAPLDRRVFISRLTALAGSTAAASALLPLGEAVSHLPEFVIEDDRIEKTRNGLSTRIGEERFVDGEAVRMEDPRGSLVAVGVYEVGENTVQPKVVLV